MWGFPLRFATRRRDIAVGACLLVAVPGIGWLLNLGHRWRVMERLYANDPPWFRGFTPLAGTLGRGFGVAAMGIAYLGPGVTLVVSGLLIDRLALLLVGCGIGLMLLAFHAFPVAMARFAQSRDPRWLLGHRAAYLEACSYGRPYVRMWMLTWGAIAISVLPVAVAVLTVQLTGQAVFAALAAPTFLLSPWAWSSLGFGFGTIIVPETLERERRTTEASHQ